MKRPNRLMFSIIFFVLWVAVFASTTTARFVEHEFEHNFGLGFVGMCKTVTDTDPDTIGNQPGLDCTITAPEDYPENFTGTVGEDTFSWTSGILKKFEVLEADKKFRYVWYISGWDTDGNFNPYFSEGSSTTRSISENTGTGTAIGSPLSATPLKESDTLTYSLSGTDASSFSIDSSTGQLRTAGSLDYETKNTYSVTVIVSDEYGGADSITVTINITKVNETVVQQPPTGGQQPQQQPDDTQQPQQPDDTQQPQQPNDTQQPQQPDDTQQSQQPDDTQQPVNNSGGSGGGSGSIEPVDNTIKPFDYERDEVGKVVFSEWMLSTKNRTPQWVELYNTTDRAIDLHGWKIVGWSIQGVDDDIQPITEQTLGSIRIKAKETYLIAAYSALRHRGSFSDDLQDSTYILQQNSTFRLWNGVAFLLELRDDKDNPIDRIGNIDAENKIKYWFPTQTRNWGDQRNRVSLIRRLKSVTSRRYNFSFGTTRFGWFAADEIDKLTEHIRSEHFYGHPTDVGTPGYRTEGADPLPVTLSSFIPHVAESGQVVLSWTTESELENAGFNIFRSEDKAGSFVKVNASLIQGAGTKSDRNEYTWIDTTAKPNIEYYYRIADVSFDGISEVLTTQRLEGIFTAKNRSLTRWALLKKGTQ